MKIRMARIDELTPDPENANSHDEAGIERIAESYQRFGQQKPIVVDANGIVRAGNGQLEAAKRLGWQKIAIVETKLTGAEATAFAIADNRSGEFSQWNSSRLASALEDLQAESRELLEATGFDQVDLDAMLESLGTAPTGGGGIGSPEATPVEIVEDEPPEPPADPVTKPGDLWLLGDHRLLCGDSTNAEDVARLMDGAKAALIHADLPYGMGKEKDGVANDNLYRDKLDAFQMQWWNASRPHIEDNASAYIWGNAADLWRLWYCGGLADSERMTWRSQIIWNKPPSASAYGSPIGSECMRSYPHGYEVCLFFMLGEQGFNNNADNYWEGWEPIRCYLEGEMKRCGWATKDLNRITGTQMAGHWVTKSQWALITAEHYAKIQHAAREHNAFKREHDDLKREHDDLKREHDDLKREWYSTRAYFDNTHDRMTDVWDFPRVTGEERHGHATPKPVSMICRAIKSSTKDGGLVFEPFLGSGTTLIAAEQLDRRCYGMEISPQYCDVIVERWEKLTGEKAELG